MTRPSLPGHWRDRDDRADLDVGWRLEESLRRDAHRPSPVFVAMIIIALITVWTGLLLLLVTLAEGL